jgi:hypothetical protein
MRLKYFGDSYDIVKHSLLRWLAPCGPWAAHPMFTESVSADAAAAFSRLLGVRLISDQVLTPQTDRDAYFAAARGCRDHLFLDPNTGVRPEVTGGADAPSYLFGRELVSIACARPDALTLVFDQCLPRGGERQRLEEKLSGFASQGLHGVAYVSHACFLLVARDRGLLEEAFGVLRRESGLPSSRFIEPKAA